MASETSRTGSLLRRFVEKNALDNEGLGINGEWTWTPERQTSLETLGAVSPSSEYNED
jgi:hypothetical protein